MSRLRILAILGVVLTGVSVGAVPVSTPSPAERLSEFRRNRRLLETLVESGVRLAAEDDPLKRAESCNVLAGRLAREVQQAAAAKQGARAAVLGEQLQALLIRGVAANLDLAQSRLPPENPPAPEAQRLGQRLAEAMKSTEEELGRYHDDGQADMQPAIKAVSRGRAEVEKAVKGRRPAPAKKHPPRK